MDLENRHVDVQSCLLIIFPLAPLLTECCKHNWEFPLHEKTIPVSIEALPQRADHWLSYKYQSALKILSHIHQAYAWVQMKNQMQVANV